MCVYGRENEGGEGFAEAVVEDDSSDLSKPDENKVRIRTRTRTRFKVVHSDSDIPWLVVLCVIFRRVTIYSTQVGSRTSTQHEHQSHSCRKLGLVDAGIRFAGMARAVQANQQSPLCRKGNCFISRSCSYAIWK